MATAADCTDREGGEPFPHEKGSLVLVKWNDGMVYFAKIKKIDHAKRRCVVIFDDRSTDEASFSQIHSVDETTTDIICIKCKKDESEHPNEIVLCDICGIGFHQKCHNPPIPASALELNNPWHCMYCVKQVKNPYLTESIDVMQSLFEEDEDADSTRILPQAVKVKVERQEEEEVYTPTTSTSSAHQALPAPPPPKKRKVGRPRLSETGGRRNSGKVRPLEALRRKLAKSTSGPGRSGAYSYRASRKRQTSQHDATSSKYGRTTVESYTIAVQQTSEGILSNSSSAVENNEDEESDSGSLIIKAKKPRSLRVSLTLPPSVDTSPVSSTTQRSPPNNNQSSWQEPALDVSESSPEPMLQIKVEESETEEGGETRGSPLTVATSASGLEQQKEALATSEAGPPPLNSTAPPPLVDLEPSNSQETDNSSNDKTSNEDVLVLSSSSSSLEAAAAPDNKKPTPSEPVPTVQGSPPEPDVIIIDDESTSSRKRKSSSSSTNSTSVATNKSPTETKAPTPSAPPDRSLVKIVPGVTSLMPSKHKRASVIHTPSPVSTPSPLEQLQMQVQAQLNRNNVYTYSGRRNSYHGSNSRTVTTSASSPAATTPLSHLNEESVNNRSSSTASQSQKHPDKIISTASTSTSSRNNNGTAVSVQQQHGNESPTANAGKTTKTNVERAFSKDIITSTRSRKPLAPPMHYVSEATTKVHERIRMLYKNSVPSTSDSTSQLVRQPNHHRSTLPSTTYVSIAPAYSNSPIYSLPSNQAGVNVTYTNSSIPTSPATVVVTPTTITATGEVGTVYTLVQADQATSFQPEMTSHVGGKDPPLHSPKVAVLTQPPNHPGAHTAVVAVAANNDPTVMGAQQQGPSAAGTYYTLVEIPDNSDRQATHYAGGSQPTVNTTKPYAVVNALPSGGRQQGSSLQLKSPPPPPPYRVQQSGRYRKHRTPSEESPTTVYNKYSPLGVSATSPSPHYQKQTQPQVPGPDLTSNASISSSNKSLNNKRGKEKEIQTTTVAAVVDKEEPLSDLIRQLGAIKSKRKRDFESMSGESLMTLFHSALKQFKENGKKYEQHLSRPVPPPPPNVEVLDNSGIPVQQTSRSSKVVRPKPQRVASQAGVSLLAQHQRTAASSPSTLSTSSFPPPSRRISPPPAYTQQQFSTGSNGKSPSAQQMHRDKAAMYHIQTSGVFVPPEEAVTHKQTSLQKLESYHHKTHQSHVAPSPHSKTPTEGHHYVLSKQPSTQQQAPAKYMQQGHQYSPLTSPPHHQVPKHPQGQHYSIIKPTARQIIKNNRTYLIADSPAAAVNMATGSVVVRRPTHSDMITTGISHSPVSSSATAVLQHPPREQEMSRSDRICTACGRDATFLCSGCHKEWYCGRECQLKSWDEHATICKSY